MTMPHSPHPPPPPRPPRPALRAAAVLLSLFMVNAAAAAPEPPQRPIAPRGPLSEAEQNHIAVFKTASRSVVHITTLEYATNLFSHSVMQIPRGTGSGFIWDERGHIVTNYHVIQGGNAARVTLADQST